MPVDQDGVTGADAFVSHLIHTCIVCSDFDRSLDFYTRILGAKVGGRVSEGDSPGLGAAMGTLGAHRWRGAMLYWGDRTRTSYIDLIWYPGQRRDSPHRSPTEPGLARLALRVSDLGLATDHLERHGVRLAGPPTDLVIAGRTHRVLFFLDPDGTLLEFSERIGPPHDAP